MFLVQNRRSKRSWRVFARHPPRPAVSREIRATREFELHESLQHFSDRLLAHSFRRRSAVRVATFLKSSVVPGSLLLPCRKYTVPTPKAFFCLPPPVS